MAIAGTIQEVQGTGTITATTPEPDSQTRILKQGDVVHEGEILETRGRITCKLVNEQGEEILAMDENARVLVDETLIAQVPAEDSTADTAAAMQLALEQGETLPDDPTAAGNDLPEDPTAAGEDDPFQVDEFGYYEGDQTAGDVNPIGLGIDTPGGPDQIRVARSSFTEPEAGGAPAPPEPEPDPIFILGSDTDPILAPSSGDGDSGTQADDGVNYDNDMDGLSPLPPAHTVNPAGSVQGAINGGDGNDLLVGDPGGLDSDVDYMFIMDVSDSTGSSNQLSDMKSAVSSAVDTLYGQLEGGDTVTITIISFAGEVDRSQTWELSLADGTDDILNWIDGQGIPVSGGTNYSAAFEAASSRLAGSETQIIFISDGITPPGYAQSLADLKDSLSVYGGSIRVAGLEIDPTLGAAYAAAAEGVLDGVDSTGDSVIVSGASDLGDAVTDFLTPETRIYPAGNDEINGNDGDDIIFGDVLNTDALADAQGVDLPEGSGWEVFQRLESDNPGWTREDTLNYIRENHETLAEETIREGGDGREGGDDVINGGAGNDIIYGQEGDDIINGGEGDDIIDGGTGSNTIDGGTGFDTLVIQDGSVTPLDFSTLSDRIDNMEKIDLDDDGTAQTVSLSLQDVLDMTPDASNTLEIQGGNDGDRVVLEGNGSWTEDTSDPSGNSYVHTTGVTVNVSDVSITVFDASGNAITTDHSA